MIRSVGNARVRRLARAAGAAWLLALTPVAFAQALPGWNLQWADEFSTASLDDLNGRLLAAWGTFGALPGGFWGVHQFHVDNEGNLYTADVHVGRPQKFRPRQGADRNRLIGAPTRAVTSTN